MEQILHTGKENTAEALLSFLNGKSNVVLVTGGESYALCGAEVFFNDVVRKAALNTVRTWEVTRIRVGGANPQVDMVQSLLDTLVGSIDGFVAIGGGSVLDTAKLLNLATFTGVPIRSLLTCNKVPSEISPSFAIPTTAGTGAEATRFAVCYDGEIKHSVDFLALRPSEVGLVSDFANTQATYQRLSTNFDAYAQAVESLWAKGATAESKLYAQRALDYMSVEDWTLGAYWAGRAIDISRTTAAHAFSYYLTSHYGIPHGHAVYMVFEYICRNNGCPDRVRTVPGLQTLREFAVEQGLDWEVLVDELFAHVNPGRLVNNPVAVRKECFLRS